MLNFVERLLPADSMSAREVMGWLQRTEASSRFGVTSEASGTRRWQKASRASGERRGLPEEESMTGSRTSGGRGVGRDSRAEEMARMMSLEKSMPVLTALIGNASKLRRICSATIEGGMG